MEATKKLGYAGEMGLEAWRALQQHYFEKLVSRHAITCGDRQLDDIIMTCNGEVYDLSNVNECVQVAGRTSDKNAIDAGDLMSCFVDDRRAAGDTSIGPNDLWWDKAKIGPRTVVHMSASAVKEVLKYHGIQLKPGVEVLKDGELKPIKPNDVIATNEAYRKLAGIDERLGSITGKELLRGLEMMFLDEMGQVE